MTTREENHLIVERMSADALKRFAQYVIEHSPESWQGWMRKSALDEEASDKIGSSPAVQRVTGAKV